MTQSVEFWCDLSTYVDVALGLDIHALEQWLDELHACSPALAGRLRAYLTECGALAGNDLVTLEGAVEVTRAPAAGRDKTRARVRHSFGRARSLLRAVS